VVGEPGNYKNKMVISKGPPLRGDGQNGIKIAMERDPREAYYGMPGKFETKRHRN